MVHDRNGRMDIGGGDGCRTSPTGRRKKLHAGWQCDANAKPAVAITQLFRWIIILASNIYLYTIYIYRSLPPSTGVFRRDGWMLDDCRQIMTMTSWFQIPVRFMWWRRRRTQKRIRRQTLELVYTYQAPGYVYILYIHVYTYDKNYMYHLTHHYSLV